VLIAGILLPLFSNMIKSKQDLSSLIKMAMTLLIVPAVGVAALSWFYNVDIMLLLSKTSPIESAQVFKYVMLSFVAMCTMYIFGTLLTANGSLKLLNTLAAIALVINLGLNIVLQPQLGAKGAAIAAICTHGFIAITNMYFAFKCLSIKLNFDYLIRFMFLLLGIIASVLLAYSTNLNLITATCLAVLSATIMLFVTRLFHIQQLKQLLQSRV
jgi:O-antigen/teichoic acid export membrane protein